jgi:hypothetical protein
MHPFLTLLAIILVTVLFVPLGLCAEMTSAEVVQDGLAETANESKQADSIGVLRASVMPPGRPHETCCPELGPQDPLLSLTIQQRDELFEEFDAEPGIDEVQRWAISHARLSPVESSALLRQARLRGVLPTVRLHARYQNASVTDWDELDVIDGRKLDSDLSLNVWLEWDLAELAAGTDMARALRESRARLELRHAVVSQVTTDYFDRRLLRAHEKLMTADQLSDIIERRLRVQELNATLDGLTGGRWSRALRSDSSERAQQDSDPGLRLPIHPVDRSAYP